MVYNHKYLCIYSDSMILQEYKEFQAALKKAPPGYYVYYNAKRPVTSTYMCLSVLSCLCCPIIAFLAIWFSVRVSEAQNNGNQMAVTERCKIVKICILSAVTIGLFTYAIIITHFISEFYSTANT